jgi:acylglycerol lipase
MASKTTAKPNQDFGTELVREWIPDGDPKATVVLVHGLAEHSGRYERPGQMLADAGFHVRSFDLVGAGGSGGRRWHAEEWDQYHDQVATHVSWAREQGKPVVLMGHSLGGLISLGYLIDDYPEPDLAVLSAPSLAGGAAWQRVLAPVLGRIAPTLRIPNSFEGEHLCRDPAVAEAYFADPLVITRSTAGFGASVFDEIDRVRDGYYRLDVPTYVFHGGDDVLVPTHCSEILEDLDNVDRRVYEGLRHETMNEPEGPQVVADLIEWLNEKLDSVS